MKRLVSLILAVLMIMSLAACGEDIRGSVDGNSNANKNDTVDTSSVEEKDEEFSFGNTDGGVYENEFIGIGLELDDNWVYLTDAEIAELNGLIADELDNELAESLKDASVINDMQATHKTTNNTVLVKLEKLSLVNSVLYDGEKYIDTALPTTKSPLEAYNVTDLLVEKQSVTFAGKSEKAMRISYNLSGVEVDQIMVCFKKGSYIALVSVATYDGTDASAMLKDFYAV